jgi:hypothetical protein
MSRKPATVRFGLARRVVEDRVLNTVPRRLCRVALYPRRVAAACWLSSRGGFPFCGPLGAVVPGEAAACCDRVFRCDIAQGRHVRYQ